MLNKFHELFISRKLFRNWLSALISYVMWKYGVLRAIDCINIRCLSNRSICVEPEFVGRIIHNYYIGYLRDVDCDGEHLILNGLRILPKPRFNGQYWDFGSVKFVRFRDMVLEIFLKQPYSSVEVYGRVVVDVGAFVGDTAIYFALKGARRVYTIEPHPGAYQEMLENIKLNNMQDRIVPINAALGSRPGIVKINNVDVETTAGMYHGLADNGVIEVPMITFKQLINDYGVEPDVLKMDCEGCEFDVVLNDYEHVRLFRELIMEYHEVDRHKLSELLTLLNRNYRCNVTKEKPGFGVLHCAKI